MNTLYTLSQSRCAVQGVWAPDLCSQNIINLTNSGKFSSSVFRLSGPRLGSSVFTQGRRQQTTEQTLSPVHKQTCDLLIVLHSSTVPRYLSTLQTSA